MVHARVHSVPLHHIEYTISRVNLNRLAKANLIVTHLLLVFLNYRRPVLTILVGYCDWQYSIDYMGDLVSGFGV